MNPNKPASKLPWSVPVAVADIPEDGKRFELVADEATRMQVAQAAGLRSLPRLQATFDVARRGSDGLRVDGEISATVGQNCVVTLEPVDNEVRETISVVFAPPNAVSQPESGEEIEIVDPDEPEPLTGGSIDLGAIATEFLILGLDPYPRKAGATFEAPAAEDDETSHPFAALAALKKSPDSKE